jgi:hypothetical protein
MIGGLLRPLTPAVLLVALIGSGIAVVVMFPASQLPNRTAKKAPLSPSASPA